MRIPVLIIASLLVACGPSAAEQAADNAAKQAARECGRAYSSSEKVLQDVLYKRGVAEVKFADRKAYIDKCVELSMSSAELKCVDPNLASGDECKGLEEDSKKKVTELQKFMMSPMTTPQPEEKKAEAPAGEAGGEAAGGAEGAPAEDGAE